MEVIQYLVQQGADIHDTDLEGDDILLCASHAGHIEVIEYLLSQGFTLKRSSRAGCFARRKERKKGRRRKRRKKDERGKRNKKEKKEIKKTKGAREEEEREEMIVMKHQESKTAGPKIAKRLLQILSAFFFGLLTVGVSSLSLSLSLSLSCCCILRAR